MIFHSCKIRKIKQIITHIHKTTKIRDADHGIKKPRQTIHMIIKTKVKDK